MLYSSNTLITEIGLDLDYASVYILLSTTMINLGEQLELSGVHNNLNKPTVRRKNYELLQIILQKVKINHQHHL